MDKKIPNESIECTVKQCAYHCDRQNYCSLDTVQIGTHEEDPKVVQCVDCNSFVAKDRCNEGACRF